MAKLKVLALVSNAAELVSECKGPKAKAHINAIVLGAKDALAGKDSSHMYVSSSLKRAYQVGREEYVNYLE